MRDKNQIIVTREPAALTCRDTLSLSTWRVFQLILDFIKRPSLSRRRGFVQLETGQRSVDVKTSQRWQRSAVKSGRLRYWRGLWAAGVMMSSHTDTDSQTIWTPSSPSDQLAKTLVVCEATVSSDLKEKTKTKSWRGRTVTESGCWSSWKRLTLNTSLRFPHLKWSVAQAAAPLWVLSQGHGVKSTVTETKTKTSSLSPDERPVHQLGVYGPTNTTTGAGKENVDLIYILLNHFGTFFW